MEAHGAGVQLQCSAALALEMGVPIYGVLAAVRTATDKQGRSVPAPGQGILVTAGQAHATGAPGVRASPMLALDYRRGVRGYIRPKNLALRAMEVSWHQSKSPNAQNQDALHNAARSGGVAGAG